MPPLRIATVDYLNARPLARGFTHGPERSGRSLLSASPAVCAEWLRAGETDVALVPSIEYQRIPDLRVLPGMAIASRRRARSVLLISRVAAAEIRSVALDASSRTSAALVRILLARRSRHAVEYRTTDPRFPAMLEGHDAALLIGDAALRADTREYRIYDLAGEWFEMTGLPFVFAFWAVRPGAVLAAEDHAAFLASRRLGLLSTAAIAAEESARLGMPAPFLEAYLKENIHYELGDAECRSLYLFYRMARESGLTPAAREFILYPPAPAWTAPMEASR